MSGRVPEVDIEAAVDLSRGFDADRFAPEIVARASLVSDQRSSGNIKRLTQCFAKIGNINFVMV